MRQDKPRCAWAKSPLMQAYHDTEWGVPTRDDGRLYEMLLLEAFQAGLSWECVLNKRPAFREAFEGFYPEQVAAFGEEKQALLAQNAAIIRNRRKIKAAVKNAAVFLDIQKEWGSFDAWLWHWTEGKSIAEYGPASSPLSDAISKDLKGRGMSFVGTTVVYAYLQAAGVINGHEPGCFLAP